MKPGKNTALVPVKFWPLMVTVVPTGPLVGVKPVTIGGSATVKTVPLVPVPPGGGNASGPGAVVPLIGAVVAPAGTSALMVMAETTKKRVLGAVLNRTSAAPVKFV